MIPQLEGELRIRCAEPADKMVLERLNGTFGGIHAMIVGLDKLDRSVVLLHEGFDWRGCLIVGDVEHWGVSLVREQLMHLCKGC